MPAEDLLEVVKKSRYPLSAFVFVQRGLDYTVRHLHGEPDDDELAAEAEGEPSSRHVTGQQLCEGLRDFAIHEYGLLARTVLKRYRIRSCEDFGKIVYAMVEAGMMRKRDEDRLDDFAGVFDFADAFAPELSLAAER